MAQEELSYEQRLAWFHQARFGLFMHGGLYSLLGRGEWAMFMERIPTEDYAKLAMKFNPKKYDPDKWAELAVKAGMTYAVLTTRHHDGVCLYDPLFPKQVKGVVFGTRTFMTEMIRCGSLATPARERVAALFCPLENADAWA